MDVRQSEGWEASSFEHRRGFWMLPVPSIPHWGPDKRESISPLFQVENIKGLAQEEHV